MDLEAALGSDGWTHGRVRGPVLVMQDTVFFSYGSDVNTRGLGSIGKSNAAHDPGLIIHNALAFTTSGVRLGILSQNIWARGEIPEEDYQEKIEAEGAAREVSDPCAHGLIQSIIDRLKWILDRLHVRERRVRYFEYAQS
jgi:hypothetical protein